MGADHGGRVKEDLSIWTGMVGDQPVALVPVNPPRRLEASGAPIVEQSHEYVIPKRDG